MKRQRKGGFLISKIHQLSGRIFNRMLKEQDITELNTAQGRIMFVLWRSDAIPISTLSEKTGLERSTLTSMLDRLEDAGFLFRETALDDRRKILIRRTEKDKAFQDRYVRVSEEMTQVYYCGFTTKEITRFEEDLERILENLKSAEAR